jgi:Spy/CpxP family protein refolding chaperone
MGIMKQRNAGLTKLLTPDQQKLYQAHKVDQMADVQTKVMTAQLNLTDAQVPQVYQINKKETAEMMQDMGNLKGAKGKLGKMKAAKSLKGDSKDKDKAMKKILTADQYTVYEKNQEQMKAAMKEKMKEKKG